MFSSLMFGVSSSGESFGSDDDATEDEESSTMMYIMFAFGIAVLVGLVVLIIVLCSCASDSSVGTCASDDAIDGKPVTCEGFQKTGDRPGDKYQLSPAADQRKCTPSASVVSSSLLQVSKLHSLDHLGMSPANGGESFFQAAAGDYARPVTDAAPAKR